MKNHFIKISTFILLAFILFACREEFLSESEAREGNSIGKNINYNQLISNINGADKLKLRIDNRNNRNQSYEDFEIDQSKILEVITSPTQQNYSMRIVLKEGKSLRKFYNLYIEKKGDSLFQTIIEYNPTINTIKNNYKNFQADAKIIYSEKKKLSAN